MPQKPLTIIPVTLLFHGERDCSHHEDDFAVSEIETVPRAAEIAETSEGGYGVKQGTREDEHLRRWLHDDVPPVIQEQDRESTIDYLKSYMPVPQENTAAVMKQLVRQSFQDLWGHFAVQLVLYSGSLLYAASIQKAGLFLLSFHIAVTGITPILLFCVILLAISTKYRYPLSWTVILLVWVSFLLLSIYTPIGSWLLSVHTLVFLAVNIGLVVVFIRQLTKLWRMERLPDGI